MAAKGGNAQITGLLLRPSCCQWPHRERNACWHGRVLLLQLLLLFLVLLLLFLVLLLLFLVVSLQSQLLVVLLLQ